MGLRRVLLWCFLGSLAITAISGLVALIFDLPESARIVGTAALVAIYSVAALACANFISARRAGIVSWAAMALFVSSLLVWLALIWAERAIPEPDLWAKSAMTMSIAGACVLQFAFLSQIGLKWKSSRAAWIGGSIFSSTAATFGLLMLWEVVNDGDLHWRLFGGMLITGLFGTFASLVLWYLERLGRAPGVDSTLGHVVPVSLMCPACGVAFVAHANSRETCPSCRLIVKIELEEPRCACGYHLYGLTSETCPECGKAIPDELCWKEGEREPSPSD